MHVWKINIKTVLNLGAGNKVWKENTNEMNDIILVLYNINFNTFIFDERNIKSYLLEPSTSAIERWKTLISIRELR